MCLICWYHFQLNVNQIILVLFPFFHLESNIFLEGTRIVFYPESDSPALQGIMVSPSFGFVAQLCTPALFHAVF